jgi:hypothetical protein
MQEGVDPYKVLGVERSASPDEIHTAYRKLVFKYHPDRGGAAWVFQQIQAAYEQIMPGHKAASGTPKPEPNASVVEPQKSDFGKSSERRRNTPDKSAANAHDKNKYMKERLAELRKFMSMLKNLNVVITFQEREAVLSEIEYIEKQLRD